MYQVVLRVCLETLPLCCDWSRPLTRPCTAGVQITYMLTERRLCMRILEQWAMRIIITQSRPYKSRNYLAVTRTGVEDYGASLRSVG